MIKIDHPDFDLKSVLDACLNSDARSDSINIYIPKLRPYIESSGIFYEQSAQVNNFHILPIYSFLCHSFFNNEDIDFLEKLYSYRLQVKPDGRYFYKQLTDEISDFCPYCNHGDVSQVDHFIPQTKFCIWNINPSNLVPICANCNKTKDDIYGTSEETNLLHPYYDNLNRDQWLFAQVSPNTSRHKYKVIYNCLPSTSSYNAIETARLQNYFQKLKLAERFTRIARSQSRDITNKVNLVLAKKTDIARRNYLRRIVTDKTNDYGLNHWSVALYQSFLNYSGNLDDFK